MYPGFDNLLAHVRARVAESGDIPPYGHIARFDNDLHLTMYAITKTPSFTPPYVFTFTLFLGDDGTPWAPLFPAVSRILALYGGIRSRSRGGFRDTPEARAELRRVRQALTAKWATIALCEATPSAKYDAWHPKALEPGDPRRWVKMRFQMPWRGFAGRLGYDWPALGKAILGSLDDVRMLLIAASTW